MMQGKTRIRYKDASENVFKIMLRTAGRYFEKKKQQKKPYKPRKNPTQTQQKPENQTWLSSYSVSVN